MNLLIAQARVNIKFILFIHVVSQDTSNYEI
jgi:hypothetical protein